MNRGFLSKRNLAIIFGAALVLTVVITAVAVGIGHPDVPSDDVAVIDDNSINIPGLVEDGVISKASFDHYLEQTAKRNGTSVPQPSDPQYEQLKDTAMQGALQLAWIVGEANKQGLELTDTQINQSLQQVKSQFKSQQEYEKARDQAGLSETDVLEQVAKPQLIQSRIQDDIKKGVSAPSDDDVKKVYDENKSQFVQQPQRTIRIIQNKDAAKVNQALTALKADDSAASWKKVAAQYSTDTTSKDKGGLRTGVVPGSFENPLDDEIFKAPTGEVQGPITTPSNTFAFEVVSATPGKDLGLGDPAPSGGGTVKDVIATQVKDQLDNDALNAFGQDFRDYWTNLTQCASDYVVQGCDNFKGGPSCDPGKLAPAQPGQAAQGCPAPVFSSCQETSAATGGQPGQLQCSGSGPAPAAPGSILVFAGSSGGLPQAPHPPCEDGFQLQNGKCTQQAQSPTTFPGLGG